MRKLFAVTSIVALGLAGAVVPAAAQTPDDGNGYLLMVHATFEPRPQDTLDEGPPPAQEAFAGTQDDGNIVLHLIPYTVDGLTPVGVTDPTVEVESLSGETFDLAPSPGTQDDEVCVEETSLPGHEGDVGDCLVAEVPADELAPADGLLVALRFTDGDGEQVERYNAPAHIALHLAIDGAPIDPATIDATLTQPTPLLVETAVDPQ